MALSYSLSSISKANRRARPGGEFIDNTDQHDHVLRPLAFWGGHQDLKFSCALGVVVVTLYWEGSNTDSDSN